MVKDTAIGAGGLRFDSRAGQIVRSCQRLATAAMLLQSSVVQALSRGNGPATHHTLRCDPASIMKI